MKRVFSKALAVVLTVAAVLSAAAIFTGCDALGNATLIVEEVYFKMEGGRTVSRVILADEAKLGKEDEVKIVFSSNNPADWFENVESGSLGDVVGLQVGFNSQTNEYYMTEGYIPFTVTIDVLEYSYRLEKGYKFSVRRNGEGGYRLRTEETEKLN